MGVASAPGEISVRPRLSTLLPELTIRTDLLDPCTPPVRAALLS